MGSYDTLAESNLERLASVSPWASILASPPKPGGGDILTCYGSKL